MFGDSNGIWTHDTALRGLCLNHLTMEPKARIRRKPNPYLVAKNGLEPLTLRVWTECSSQLSYFATWLRE